MGCVATIPKTDARRKYTASQPKPSAPVHGEIMEMQITRSPNEIEFEEIVKNVFSIVHIEGSSPVVCISENAFPIIIEPLYSEENEQVSFNVPIIAGAKYNGGKVLCFGNSFYFAPKVLAVENTEELMHNCLRWITTSHFNPEYKGKCILIGFDEKEAEFLHSFLKRRKFTVTIVNNFLHETIHQFQYIFISLNFHFTSEEQEAALYDAVSSGCSLLVFAANNQEFVNYDMNSFLVEIGLVYPGSNFVLGSYSNSIQINKFFNEVNQARFSYVKDRYIELLHQENIDVVQFDTVISVLHLYTQALEIEHFPLIENLFNETMDYLNRTNYITDDGIAPLQLQTLAIVHLTSLLIKFPLVLPKGCPTIDKFPGIAGPAEKLGSFQRKIMIKKNFPTTWYSTGLWLPAATSATIQLSNVVPNTKVQIGSHCVELTCSEGPYQRWPLIVNETPLDFVEVEVVSPFGGLVYIVTEEYEGDEQEITFSFNNFLEAPRYIDGEPEIWEKTKQKDVPWCELESENIIFTIPTNLAREISEIPKVFEVYSNAIQSISKFMRVQMTGPIRIVFDNTILPSSLMPRNYNPIYLHTRDGDKPFLVENPSAFLFKIFQKIAMSMVINDVLDKLTKKTLSIIATAEVFMTLWPDQDPFLFTNNNSQLTQSLWEIRNEIGDAPISKTIDDLRSILTDPSGSPDDSWIAFVMLLSKNGQKNFTQILQKSRPIPLNATLSVRQLPAFKKN